MAIKFLRKHIPITTMAVVVTILAAACGGSAPEALEIPVRVVGDTMTPETIRVKQGDMVTLKIQAEEAGEFHLHGYDIKKDVVGGGETDFYFVADATGRFNIVFHHTEEGDEKKDGLEEKGKGHEEDDEEKEIEIGFLEVGPR
jgi:hypothetical protein